MESYLVALILEHSLDSDNLASCRILRFVDDTEASSTVGLNRLVGGTVGLGENAFCSRACRG